MADSAPAWQQAHLVLAAASLLGIGAVLGLHSLAPRRGRLAIAADVAAAMGVAAAGLVAGLVLAEVVIVAPVARACAEASACLSPTNEAFLARFADSSWSDLTVLSFAAGTLIFSIGALAILGRTTKSVRVWEAALIAIGVIGIYATNTVLHGDAKYGLLVLLVGSTSIAIRMVRRRRNG